MKRRLLILNVALLVAIVWTGTRAWNRIRAEHAREDAALKRKAAAAQGLPYSPLAQAPAAMPSAYVDIAQKMLFDKSRNPTVVIEAPAAPPPKPMPALPVYHGQLNFGDGPIVMLSESGSAAQHGIRVGGEIGPFKLLAADPRELTFDWDGQTVRRSVDELKDRGNTPQAAPPPADRSSQAAPAPQPAQPQPTKIDPAAACIPNDGRSDGTVVDGYRKVVWSTAFGPMCRWEPVR